MGKHAHRRGQQERKTREHSRHFARLMDMHETVAENANRAPPSNVPWMKPIPPKIEVTPSTTAVIAKSS